MSYPRIEDRYGPLPLDDVRESFSSLSADGPSPAWTRTPLIAFALFTVGPLLICVILYVVYTMFGIKDFSGRGYALYPSLVFWPFIFSIATWPFLLLSVVCNRLARKQGSNVRSMRVAMWASLLAMSLPCSLFLIASPEEMILTAPDAGQGTGIVIGIMMFVVPILGSIGWVVGRFIAMFFV